MASGRGLGWGAEPWDVGQSGGLPPTAVSPPALSIAAWRARYDAALPGCRRIVGLVGGANPTNQSGPARSVPVAELAALGGLDGVGFVGLQGGGARERPQLSPWFDAFADGPVVLPGLASAIAATDLLVTVDTLAMHLAGATGHTAHVLATTAAPGFVLGRETDGCGWYRSRRLHRQGPGETWERVVEGVRAAVEAG